MIKIFTVSLFILIGFFSKAEDTEQLYQKYFFDYWTTSTNVNFKLSTYYGFDEEDSEFKLIKNILQTVIKPSADKYTIYQADNICHTIKDLTDWCHDQDIHKIHYQIDPENVNAYILDLHTGDNEKHIKSILEKATRKSKYSDSFYMASIINNAELLMEFHIQFPDALKLGYGDDIQDFISEMKKDTLEYRLKEKGLIKDSFDEIMNYALSSYFVGMTSLEQHTTLFFLLEICQNLKHVNQCNSISRILINSPDTDSEYATGKRDWEIFVNTSEVLQINKSEIVNITANNKKREIKIRCYTSPDEIEFSLSFNITISRQYFLDKQKHGELEASKRVAHEVYETIKQHGFQPDFNPNDCE